MVPAFLRVFSQKNFFIELTSTDNAIYRRATAHLKKTLALILPYSRIIDLNETKNEERLFGFKETEDNNAGKLSKHHLFQISYETLKCVAPGRYLVCRLYSTFAPRNNHKGIIRLIT